MQESRRTFEVGADMSLLASAAMAKAGIKHDQAQSRGRKTYLIHVSVTVSMQEKIEELS